MDLDHEVAGRVVVRVLGSAGEPVGAGFLLGPDRVATCAHVVADALAGDAYAQAAPGGAVRVDFPLVDGEPAASRSATAARWVPIGADGSGDVAVLDLDEPAPAGARMPPLRRIDRLWGASFRVLGFPDGLVDGVWSTGVIRGRQATGWFQLQAAAGDQPIVGGFSGSPVWDEDVGAVVGMTVAADASGATTTAYVIPVDQVLGVDPESLPCPYRGLEPFDEEHAEYFFGREDELAQLADVLARQPLVTVAGPSGTGKSSLVRAGILPRVRTRGGSVVELRPQLRDSADDLLAGVRPDAGGTVVLLDQFEEYAAADPGGARALLTALGERLDVAEKRSDGTWTLQVLLTSRTATLEDVLAPEFAARLGAGTVLVPPMGRGQLRDAIIAPAERAPGLTFEPGLVERILDDAAAEPGCLPLVESLLTELWERRRGGTLTIEAYERSGGVAGVVAKRAEDVVASLPVPPDDPQLRRLFTALAGPGPGGGYVRRAVPRADLDPALAPLVDAFVAGRLIVVERPPDGRERLQLAHQALIEHWPRLREWLAEDREFLAWRDDVAAQQERWTVAGADDGALLRGVALAAAGEWLPRRAADVPAPVQEFVTRSRARQRREVRRWRVITAVLAVLVLAAGALAAVAVARGEEVSRQLRLANAAVLAQAAGEQLPGDPVTASALALAAHRADPDNGDAQSVLARLALSMRSVEAVHVDVTDEPITNSVRADRDADTLLARDMDDAVVVRDAYGPSPARWTLPGFPPGPRVVGLTQDGGAVYTYDDGGNVMVWDVAQRTGPIVVSEGLGPVVAKETIASSADGNLLYWQTKLPDGTRRFVVWDIRAAAPAPSGLPPITDPNVTAIHLAPDPTLAIEVNRQVGLVFRSLADGQVRRTVHGVDGHYAVFGQMVVSCVPGGVLVRDTVSGQELRVPRLADDCTNEVLNEELVVDGEFLMEARSAADEPDLARWRITSLRTGQAYELLLPPRDRFSDGFAPRIDATIEADHLVVHVPQQRSVLRVRAEPADSFVSSVLSRDGRHELLTESDAETVTAAIDVQTRAVAGRLPVQQLVDRAEPAIIRNEDDTIGVLTTTADHHSYAEYTVSDFERTGAWTLPGRPRSDRPPGIDARGDRVVALDDGVLVGWDRRTGAPVGPPIHLATDAQRARWFSELSRVALRPGTDDEVAVAAPQGPEVWNLTTGRRITKLGSEVTIVRFGPTGELLITLAPRVVRVFDVATEHPVGPPLAINDTVLSLGLLSDGHLVNLRRSDLSAGYDITVHDLDSGRERVAFTLPTWVETDSFLLPGDRLNILTDGGGRPFTFPLDARVWAEDLCRLTDRPFTDTERSLLPPTVDAERPCEP